MLMITEVVDERRANKDEDSDKDNDGVDNADIPLPRWWMTCQWQSGRTVQSWTCSRKQNGSGFPTLVSFIDHQYYQIILAQRWRLGLCVLHTAHRGKKSFYQKVDNYLRNWFLSALMLC